jgi:SlyX protein
MNEFTDDLTDLQTRVIFQEDTLQQLNSIVTKQDHEIRELQQQLKSLAKRFEEFLYAQEQNPAAPAIERPPHY